MVTTLEVRQIIEAARRFAGMSYVAQLAFEQPAGDERITREFRVCIAMEDCYLAGVEETLKRIMGDASSEPFRQEHDHQTRIAELLKLLGVFLINNGCDIKED